MEKVTRCVNSALMLAVPWQDSYIQSRADTMQNIESTIVELGSIFQQLAHMVKEQEETIQRWEMKGEDNQSRVYLKKK